MVRRSATVLLLILGLAGKAQAQDDWGMTRPGGHSPPSHGGSHPNSGPHHPRVHDTPAAVAPHAAPPAHDEHARLLLRYTAIVEHNPSDPFAVRRVFELRREADGSLEKYSNELAARVASEHAAFAPRVLLAALRVEEGKKEEAILLLREAHALNANDLGTTTLLAQLLRETGQIDEAVTLYESVLSAARDDVQKQDLVRTLADIALDRHDDDRARNYFRRLIPVHGASVFLSTEFARALTARGEHAKAAAELLRVLESMRGDARVLAPLYRDLGREYIADEKWDDAVHALDAGVRVAGDGGVRHELLELLVDVHRHEGNLREYAANLRAHASGFEAWELVGRLQDELGEDDGALDAYRHALLANPSHLDTRVRIVHLLARTGRLTDVVAEYRAMLRLAPHEHRFVVELANFLMQLGERDEALRVAADASHRAGNDVSVHEALAELYSKWNELHLAEEETTRVARLEPRDTTHLVALGTQQLEAGDAPSAIATWRKILDIEQNPVRAHLLLAGVLADHDRLDESIVEYRDVISRDAGNLDALRGIAAVYERMQRVPEAIRSWQAVLDHATQDAAIAREARQHLVAGWKRTGELAQRIVVFEQNFGQNPPNLDAGRFLVEAYQRTSPPRLDDDERVLARLIETVPGDVESLLALERLRRSRGDLVGTLDALTRLVEADDRRASTYLQRMVEDALALYHDDDALRYAERAVLRNPDDANAHRRLGDLYRSRHDDDHALTSYAHAVRLDDRMYATHVELAEMLASHGEVDRADALLRKVIHECPDDELVARAGRAAIALHVAAGTLEKLEHDLLPWALAQPGRALSRRLLVDIYRAWLMPKIIEMRVAGGDTDARRKDLERIGSRALKPLVETLSDDEPGLRDAAVELLGALGNSNAASALLGLAESHAETELRVRAVLAAGAVAVPDLASRFMALVHLPEARLHEAATWALVNLAYRARAEAESSRGHSSRNLAEITGFLGELSAWPQVSVRALALLGLGFAGDPARAQSVWARLEDPSEEVRMAAAWCVGEMRPDGAFSRLTTSLRTRRGDSAAALIGALASLHNREAAEAVGRSLFSRDVAANVMARSLLGYALAEAAAVSKPPVAMRPFVPLALVHDFVASSFRARAEVAPVLPAAEIVAKEAINALSGTSDAEEAVLNTLLDPEFANTLVGAAHVSEFWPALAPTLLPALVALSRSTFDGVRIRAVRVLGAFSSSGARDAIAAVALHDASSEIRATAIHNFDEHYDVNLVHDLEALLTDTTAWTLRVEVVAALGRMHRDEAVPALTAALRHDSFAFVRAEAATALGRLHLTQEARAALLEAQRSDVESAVQSAAERVLKNTAQP